MKTATLTEIKKELARYTPKELADLLLRVAKYKKDNKEFISYLLFEAGNEALYIDRLKAEIDTLFEEVVPRTEYYTKKVLRKIIKIMNKYLKYSGNKESETEVRLYFCFKCKAAKVPIRSGNALGKIYQGQVEKIRKLIPALHEDLQYDYGKELESLGV